MTTSTRADGRLFRRGADEGFDSLTALRKFCATQRDDSRDVWCTPRDVAILRDLTFALPGASDLRLNDWSFTQLCRLAGMSRGTLDRLSPRTVARALGEALRQTDRRLEWLTTDGVVRSVRNTLAARSWNDALLEAVGDAAPDFHSPRASTNGAATGFHCGEQDLFCFLIDPRGWIEVGGDAFAPGFFVWNSEVGRRAAGIQSFWYQHVARSHVVWDPVHVVEFPWNRVATVRDGLAEIRRFVHALRQQRTARRDRFAAVLRKARVTRLGDDAEAVAAVLARQRIPRRLAKSAIETVREQGADLTLFAVVEALARRNRVHRYVADRTVDDARCAKLLSLAE